MQLMYNSIIPIIVNRCKAFPLGKYFTKDDKGKVFTVDDKTGRRLLNLGTKSAKHFIEGKKQPKKAESENINKLEEF